MNKQKLYGAILGDLVGKPYEMKPIYSKEFDWYNPENHWTDDTLMTLATANKLLNDSSYEVEYKWWGNQYYGDYYGKNFKEWIKAPFDVVNESYGNGAAMRVAPIGYFFNNPHDAWIQAMLSTSTSHNHPQSRHAATFVTNVIHLFYTRAFDYLAKADESAEAKYGSMIFQAPKPFEKFKVSCNDTVPVAYQVFRATRDGSIEDCIRLAVSLGGDCDTIGSMAAEMWVAYNGGLEEKYVKQVEASLDAFQLSVLHKFNESC